VHITFEYNIYSKKVSEKEIGVGKREEDGKWKRH
jgi:hypothetical protein